MNAAQQSMSLCEECRMNGGLIPTMTDIAKQAAHEVVHLHKMEMELRFRDLKDEIVGEIVEKMDERNRLHYGDMKPHEHHESHMRLDRLLKFLDDFKSSILRKLVTAGLLIMIGGAIVMLLFWDKIKAAIPGAAIVVGG